MQYRWLKENKYYNVHLQLNLFGGTSVICSWGSINNKQGGYKITFCNNQLEVDATLNAIIKRRKTRGYQNYGQTYNIPLDPSSNFVDKMLPIINYY